MKYEEEKHKENKRLRILIASQPVAGHIVPLRELARELSRRGHEVRWYTGRKYKPQIEAVGAEWEGFVHARDYDDSDLDSAFPGRSELQGLEGLLFDLEHIFVGQIEGQFHDLRDIERRWRPDVVLADQTVGAALLREELGGPPVALLGVLPLGIPDRQTAPFGLGLPPHPGLLGRLRNAALYALTEKLIFRRISAQMSDIATRLGTAARSFAPPVAPSLMLQPSIPAFEYPRSDLPPQLHFIGPILPRLASFTPPPWWEDVIHSARPVVLVTQGTLATKPEQLLKPVLEALANEDVLVVVAGASPEQLGSMPENARATAFIPFAALLPHVAVYLTNGGYGGTLQALAYGIPCVVAGRSEDKSEVAARVAYSGVGINLGTATPTPAQIRSAVSQMLRDGRFRQQAAELGTQLREHDAVKEGADLIEALVI